VEGDPLSAAAMCPGDSFAVDKRIQTRHGQIVAAFISGGGRAKRLSRKAGQLVLLVKTPA
jgi:SOS-response transcriptional repressor LexA